MVNIIPTKCEEKTEDYLLGVGIPACWRVALILLENRKRPQNLTCCMSM